jgi:hypothetical protein
MLQFIAAVGAAFVAYRSKVHAPRSAQYAARATTLSSVTFHQKAWKGTPRLRFAHVFRRPDPRHECRRGSDLASSSMITISLFNSASVCGDLL